MSINWAIKNKGETYHLHSIHETKELALEEKIRLKQATGADVRVAKLLNLKNWGVFIR